MSPNPHQCTLWFSILCEDKIAQDVNVVYVEDSDTQDVGIGVATRVVVMKTGVREKVV